VKYFDWNELKNQLLKSERSIGFEDILIAVEDGNVLAVIDHPKTSKYPDQKVLVVLVDKYVYVVPYVEDDSKLFLKTIYPSRKLTKQYMKGEL
jgi:hypothetical protein